MSGFFNANVTSPFPDANMLFDPAKAQQTAQAIQHNQLGLQAQQLDLTAADHEQVGRLAAGLLAEPDLGKRADLYARGVGMLQAQNLAKYAPPTLPDEGVLRSLVSQSVPVADQIKMGFYTPPGLTEALARASAPPPGYGATTGAAAPSSVPIPARGTGGSGASASAPTAWLPYFEEASKETGIPVDLLIAQARQESGFNADAKGGAGEVGLFQIKPSTASSPGFGLPPVDPASITGPDNVRNNIMFGARYLKARMGGGDPNNPAVQAAGLHAYNGGGDPNYVANVFRYRPTLAPSDPNAAVTAYTPPTGGGTTTATAQPGATPPPTQYAGPGAPGAPTLPPAATETPPGPAQPPGATAAPAQPGQPQPAAAPAAAAQPGATPLPGTGVNSQQFQTALWKTQQAAQLETQFPNSPAAKAKAVELRAEAALYMQADSVITLPNGIQVKALSGQQVDAAKPLPHYVYDAAQHAYIDTTGTNKPEFEPAQRDSAVAQRDVMELGPKVANGTATPQEVARYNVAATTYMQPVLRENPVTKETVRVPTRELPPNFPQPSGAGVGGAPGGAGTAGGANVVMPGLSPAQQQVERDPAAYKVSESQYDRDSKEIAAIGDAGRQSQADQVRVKEMQDVLQKFNSGRGTEAATAAAAWFNSWAPAGLTGWKKESENLSGSQAAEAFSKLALVGAGTQERGVLGARGGYQAIKLFKEANPNINLQDATNKSILDMQLISNQANADYSQAALSHFADNEKKFSATHQYDSLAQFDRNWNGQRNPQVYAAAMGAIAGQPPSQWTKGLSDDEYARALQIVQRAKPSAVVQTKSGPYSMQPNAVTTGTSAAPGAKVIRFDHNGNQIQ